MRHSNITIQKMLQGNADPEVVKEEKQRADEKQTQAQTHSNLSTYLNGSSSGEVRGYLEMYVAQDLQQLALVTDEVPAAQRPSQS